MTVEEIYKLPKDEFGWRMLPNGNRVSLGDYVTLGNHGILGNNVSLGNNVTLGDGVILGNNVSLGNKVFLGDNVTLGNGVSIGNNVTLGDGVSLGDRVSIETQPLQLIGTRHPITVLPDGSIRVGCLRQSAEWWLENHARCGEENGYTEKQIAEYAVWIRIAAEHARSLVKP